MIIWRTAIAKKYININFESVHGYSNCRFNARKGAILNYAIVTEIVNKEKVMLIKHIADRYARLCFNVCLEKEKIREMFLLLP